MAWLFGDQRQAAAESARDYEWAEFNLPAELVAKFAAISKSDATPTGRETGTAPTPSEDTAGRNDAGSGIRLASVVL